MTRSFSFRTAGLLLLGACLSLPLSAKESAEGFSRQVALSLQGEGPWYRLSIPMSVQLSAAHADPVSYTHLDVYKRQSAKCCWRGKSSARWSRAVSTQMCIRDRSQRE